MPKVEIIIAEDPDPTWHEYARVTVLVDGVEVGGGGIGGEDEDNTRGRTYEWIEKTLQALAQALGADVKVTETELEPDDDSEEL